MKAVTPFLWFDDNLEDALDLYATVFTDMKVHDISRAPDGSAFTADFEIGGTRLRGLNGGPHFHFTEAISMFVECEDQAEVDRLWRALTADGGEEVQCGWLKDRFGLSWQIVPAEFLEMASSGDAERVDRMMAAMLTMRKLDLAALRSAFEG